MAQDLSKESTRTGKTSALDTTQELNEVVVKAYPRVAGYA